MIIIGAGMAGLIAAQHFRPKLIIESQESLPNNHHALLRFRTDEISKLTRIAFRKVNVTKAVVHDEHFLDKLNPYSCNQYSLKVTGKITERSIMNIEPGPRYIAPSDFIGIMAACQEVSGDILYNVKFDMDWYSKHVRDSEPVVSTIPMPVMMDIVGWKDKPKFDFFHVWTTSCKITSPNVDVFQTIYFTSINVPHYRASLTGDRLIIESVKQIDDPDALIEQVIDFFGLPKIEYTDVENHEQIYGKIVPIDEDIRKEFMYTLTREFNIYSLGRFATWRQILLDDLAKDIRVIESLIDVEDRRRRYHQSLAILPAH